MLTTSHASARVAGAGASQRSHVLLWLAAIVLGGLLALVLVTVAFEAARYFSSASIWEFFTGLSWTAEGGGMWPFLAGTFVVGCLSLAIAVPLSILIAVFTSVVASHRTRRWLKPTIEVLASVPAVVYAFFALTTIGPALASFLPIDERSALVAATAIALMITPGLASLCDDAIVRVPSSVRESAYALGADSASATWHVLLPTARPAITAAVLLSLSRALGETVIVLLLSRASEGGLPLNPLEPTVTITSHTILAGESAATSPLAYQSSFALLGVLALVSILIHRLTRANAPRGMRSLP